MRHPTGATTLTGGSRYRPLLAYHADAGKPPRDDEELDALTERRTRRRVISHEDAVTAGTSHYLAHSDIDMEALASELGVSRATLYRVVESRDRLLGDVLWGFGASFFARSVTEAQAVGVDRIIEVLRRFGERLFTAEAFRRFLVAEPDTAVRVLFTQAGRVHERFVAVNAELLQSAVDAGEITPRFDVDGLAYMLVRLYESMWYADLLSGRERDVDLVEYLARQLLTSE